MLIAVDGPLASGKGTIAKHLANWYHLPYLDTGLLYRACALGVLQSGEDPSDEVAAAKSAKAVDRAALDHFQLRSARIGAAASKVAAIPAVRNALMDYQRRFAEQDGGAVLDGRDIGTVICPKADVKLWIYAPAEVRATRRHKELLERGEDISKDEVLAQLRERDSRDAGRPYAPMLRAVDAHLLNTGDLSIDAAFEVARRIIDAAQAEHS
ncbi:MAG: cytidylate kinase [Robiginitomaculum sp.]|nr:MAG: cytidylate kinase [Robiginitomaculum sp.]